MNEPEVAYRNKLTILAANLNNCLGISYCSA